MMLLSECRRHPLLITSPVTDVTVGVLQASVAIAEPRAASIAADVGLQPRLPFAGVPVAVIVGAVTSTVHVAVRDAVAVLPQASVAVNVLVCERPHPLLITSPVAEVTVGVLQASVAVAEPRAASIAADVGLHPRAPLAGVPVAVIVGAVTSTVHVAVREAVAVLPQASVAVNVLVCERLHPLLITSPVTEVTVGVLHASVAVAEPRAASIAADVGLHPRAPLAGVPVAVIVGAVMSTVHVAVRDAVAVLPQASVAVHVLVCERAHPLLATAPSDEVNVGVLQASVAVAEPNAALIAADVGLQPRAPLAGVPVAVIVGAVTSTVHVAVRDAVAVLPQASVAVNVLVCERPHPLLATAPSDEVNVGVLQASVAVAEPNAALIAADVGLQPRAPLAGVPVAVIVGAVTSTVHVAVRDAVAV